MRTDPRLPASLGAVLIIVFLLTFFTTPEGKLNWLLEVGPGLVGLVALVLDPVERIAVRRGAHHHREEGTASW